MYLNLLKNNNEALELLDWFKIVKDISSLSHFDITKKSLLKSPESHHPSLIQNKLDQLNFYIEKHEDLTFSFNSIVRLVPDDEIKFSQIKDIFKSRFFEAEELHYFALIFSAFKDTRLLFLSIPHTSHFEVNHQSLEQIRKDFLSPLREFVDHSGKISYERHPILKQLNTKLLQIEHELRNSIHKISLSEPYSSRLQIDNFDIIHDRYVLAIRSDSYQSNLGSIVARSQSGMTLFVEPFELREKSSTRLHLLSEIESTILSLTINLSKILHPFAHIIQNMSEALVEFDLLNTKATYSLKNNLCRPVISKEFHLELRGFFHPLIPRSITNNIDLSFSKHGLILSGPNTGGKTVALKSMCLSVLFCTWAFLFLLATPLFFRLMGFITSAMITKIFQKD